MNLFSSPPPQARLTLRVLAHLLRYPDAAFRAHTAELQQALRTEAALPAPRLAELDALLDDNLPVVSFERIKGSDSAWASSSAPSGSSPSPSSPSGP